MHSISISSAAKSAILHSERQITASERAHRLICFQRVSRMRISQIFSSIVLVVATTSLVSADVKLASPFTSHMVLQREMEVPVWGRAEAGEEVTVEFAGNTATATANGEGKWELKLPSMSASGEGRTFVVRGSQTAQPLELDDVLVGEVWLCSGQSNMDFPMSVKRAYWGGVENEEEEIAAANFPQIRMFTAKPVRSYRPQEFVEGQWLVCSPETVPGFSAVGYFFARDLHQEIDVPVGILTLSYGASCAQAWIRREAIEAAPELKLLLERFDQQVKEFTNSTPDEAVEPRRRRKPTDPSQDQHNPTVMYNGVVAPCLPYAVRGVLWYQGESITEPRELFPHWNATLISDWRKLWGRELPFYFCQLAAHGKTKPQVRAWQAQALEIPGTAMAVTIDIGDFKDVHPPNKQDVGDRLCRIALANVYGKAVEYSGPRLESAQIDDQAVRLEFSHVGGGLVAKGGPLKTFELAGADGEFRPADAIIEGDSVVVQSDDVQNPVAVRYAWANYPEGCNLQNRAGLPAPPFLHRIEH